MNKYLTELIGTFFLVLTIGCTVIGAGPRAIPPLAIGAMLMVMVYAGGHVSGAHYNPAVTLGAWIRGRHETKDIVPYWVAQVVGALAAAFVSKAIVGSPEALGFNGLDPKPGPAFIAEFLFTFALVYVVLNVATAKGTSGNSFYGLAIGMTVMSAAFAIGLVSGGALNPAVAIGLATMGLIKASSIWIHLVADIGGGLVAGALFKQLNPADK